MFDVGFSELVMVFIVGLVVLGPKRLPIAIRTVMGWIRTIRGLASNVQKELAQELKLQELQESIKKAEALNLSKLSPELSQTVEELKQSAQKMQADLASAKREIEGLTEKQVADIQQKIELENQQLEARSAVQTVSPEERQFTEQNNLMPQGTQEDISLAEMAEQAEMDESQFQVYYPPDDDLATPEPASQQKQDKA